MRYPTRGDIVWLDDVVDDWPCTLRWDVKGHTPTAPSLVARLWDGVTTQRVVVGSDGSPRGLLQLVDVDLIDGSARLEALVRREDDVVDAWRSFVDEVTAHYPLRSVDVVAAADELRVGVIDPEACEIGRLRARRWRGCGRYADLVVHEIGLTAGLRRR